MKVIKKANANLYRPNYRPNYNIPLKAKCEK